MPAATSRFGYIAGFDGIRAIAVIAVFLFHTGHLSGGFLGVDLFFSLSGFLITTLLLIEFEATGAISIAGFWNRRLRRLAPALVLVVGASYLLVALRDGLDVARATQPDALCALAYVSNWCSLSASTGVLTPYIHLWSLAVEAQFYLVWPLVAVALTRVLGGDRTRLSRRLLIAGAVGVVASVVLTAVLYQGPDSLSRVYFGTDTHAAGILLGCVLACAAHRWGRIPAGVPAQALHAAAWLALAGIVGCWLVLVRDQPAFYRSGQYLGFSVLAVVVIAHLAQGEGSLLGRALAVWPLRQLGVISYGVYVWHWLVVYLTPSDRLALSEWWRALFQAAVTIALATVSYYVIEDPIRRRRRPFTRAPHAAPATAGTAP